MARLVRKGDNKWLVRVFMGRDAVGKQIFHNKTIIGNKKTALGYARDVETRRDLGTWAEPTELTLGEYLDKWLAEGLSDVQPRTRADYDSLLKRWVRPKLGKRKLLNLTPLDIQSLYNDMHGRGLSGRSIQYTHAVLSSALKQAVGWRLVSFNPSTYTKRPQTVKTEIQFLQPEEAERFLIAARSDEHGVALTFALATGMRPEEYLGLKWEDVDLENGTATVRQVMIERTKKEGGWYFGPPKTAGSRRMITLTATVVGQLAEHKRRQLEYRMKAGPKYQQHDLVFAVPYSTSHRDATGGPLAQRNLHRRHLIPVLGRAGLPISLHLYCLRHTYATLSLAGGMDAKIVSHSMGHSSVAFTLDTYQHILPSMRQAAAEILERLLFSQKARS